VSDLNQLPSVLQTDALPDELIACEHSRVVTLVAPDSGVEPELLVDIQWMPSIKKASTGVGTVFVSN
jgi:hypothetical protein